jgi:hypothetical protein
MLRPDSETEESACLLVGLGIDQSSMSPVREARVRAAITCARRPPYALGSVPRSAPQCIAGVSSSGDTPPSRASNRSELTGLTRCSSKPARRAFMRSDGWP